MIPGELVSWSSTDVFGGCVHRHTHYGQVVAVSGQDVLVDVGAGQQEFVHTSRLLVAQDGELGALIWNSAHRPGAHVSVLLRGGSVRVTWTASEACMVDGEACVKLRGLRGWHPLRFVRAL